MNKYFYTMIIGSMILIGFGITSAVEGPKPPYAIDDPQLMMDPPSAAPIAQTTPTPMAAETVQEASIPAANPRPTIPAEQEYPATVKPEVTVLPTKPESIPVVQKTPAPEAPKMAAAPAMPAPEATPVPAAMPAQPMPMTESKPETTVPAPIAQPTPPIPEMPAVPEAPKMATPAVKEPKPEMMPNISEQQPVAQPMPTPVEETPTMNVPAPEKPMEAPMPTETPAPEMMNMGEMK